MVMLTVTVRVVVTLTITVTVEVRVEVRFRLRCIVRRNFGLILKSDLDIRKLENKIRTIIVTF